MRLLTWNVQWCRGVDGAVDPARIAAEIRRIDPDVVCLQEIAANFPDLPGSRGEDQPLELMRALPGYEGCLVSGVDLPGPHGRRSRFGNLILSRLPVGRVLRHALPWPPSDTPSMQRSAVEAVVRAPSGPLRVLTTHLEYYSGAHRAAQIERLRELHAGTNRETASEEKEGPFRPMPRPRSAIACGDFNLPPEDPLRGRMCDPFQDGAPRFVDAWETLNPGAPHPHSFRVHEPGEKPYCCDYVFVTEDLAPRLARIEVDGANRASDHQPIIVDLK